MPKFYLILSLVTLFTSSLTFARGKGQVDEKDHEIMKSLAGEYVLTNSTSSTGKAYCTQWVKISFTIGRDESEINMIASYPDGGSYEAGSLQKKAPSLEYDIRGHIMTWYKWSVTSKHYKIEQKYKEKMMIINLPMPGYTPYTFTFDRRRPLLTYKYAANDTDRFECTFRLKQ
jgi:hypothetical protein